MTRCYALSLCTMAVFFWGCDPVEKSPNLPSENYRFVDKAAQTLPYREVVYVPVYSAIYRDEGSRIQLAATLSIRNTSLSLPMYVTTVDYYDSTGERKRQYIDRSILIKPLESIEFFVPYSDKEGGVGANFIVEWGAMDSKADPIVQAVIIGAISQIGISFVGKSKTIEVIDKTQKTLSP